MAWFIASETGRLFLLRLVSGPVVSGSVLIIPMFCPRSVLVLRTAVIF
jgi:hypothetical protein